MSVRSAQSVTVDFATQRFDTGAATNADSTPTGTLVVNGTDNAASVTVTNVTTGAYKAAVTLPTLAVGDIVQLRIAATVSSVAGVGVVWTDTKDMVIDSAGLVDANTVKVGPTGSGTAQTARDIGADTTTLSGALAPISSTVNDAAATTTGFVTALSSATTDFYAGDLLVFTSGALAGVARHISAYNGSTKAVTLLTALPSAPANSVSFTLVPTGKRLVDFLGTLDSSNRVDVGKWLSNAVTVDGNNTPNVSTKYVGGTLQTAGDIPARLPAALTVNGNIKASVLEFLTTALTETAGQITAAFKKFFDIASPTSTANRITLVDAATNLTNLPTVPNNWITAAGITAGALNGKGDWSTIAPDNANIAIAAAQATTAATNTASLPTLITGGNKFTATALSLAPTGGGATVSDILGATASDYNTPGTVGAKINAAATPN